MKASEQILPLFPSCVKADSLQLEAQEGAEAGVEVEVEVEVEAAMSGEEEVVAEMCWWRSVLVLLWHST